MRGKSYIIELPIDYIENKSSKYPNGFEVVSLEGYKYEVVGRVNRRDYYYVFTKSLGGVLLGVHRNRLSDGHIKNPFHRSVCNVGYLGEGPYEAVYKGKPTKRYSIWKKMIERCANNSNYKDVSVCKEWLNFQIFSLWFEENYIDDFELDKDLLSGDSKVYSPETCLFLPKKINCFLRTNWKTNTSGSTGVHFRKTETNSLLVYVILVPPIQGL